MMKDLDHYRPLTKDGRDGYRYLVRDKHRLVQLLAASFFGRDYFFYTTGLIPEEKDAETVDARLILRYRTDQSAGKGKPSGSVKYLRMGRWWILMSTHGKNAFFTHEGNIHDIREKPLVVEGYSIRRDKHSGKVSVSLSKKAEEQFRREIEHRYRFNAEYWECFFWDFPYRPYNGVRTVVFKLLEKLNTLRGEAGLSKISWRTCVRKKIDTTACYLKTPRPIVDLIAFERWQRKSRQHKPRPPLS